MLITVAVSSAICIAPLATVSDAPPFYKVFSLIHYFWGID